MALNKDLEKILKIKDSNEAISELVNVLLKMNDKIEELEAKIDDLEEENSIINEELDMLSTDMQLENYGSVFAAICPYCNEEIEIDLEELEEGDDFVCPHCEKEIALEWSEDCDCGCCDHDHDDCDCDDCDCDDCDCEDEE